MSLAGKPPDNLFLYFDFGLLSDNEAGADAIRVGRVAGVAVAVGVDIPEVRGAADIRRTQPPGANIIVLVYFYTIFSYCK